MRPRIGTLLVALAATALPAHAQTPQLMLSSELTGAPLLAQTQLPAFSPNPATAAATLPPLEADLDPSYGRPLESSVGLRPSSRSRDNISLPFGMNYRRGSLAMSLDEKNESGFGLQLYMNRAQEVELAPSGLGLQPKPTPGIIFNKRF